MKTHAKRGSSLFAVVIISTALAIGIASTLRLVTNEFRLNKKVDTYHEAKQAAESILQAGMADLYNRFERQTAFPIDTLSPKKNPLYLSDEFVTIHEKDNSLSNLVIPTKKKYSSIDDFTTEDTEIIGGQIPPGRWVYIDPRIPGNEDDELKDTRVFERSIEMISKATVDKTNVGNYTVYARQFLQVRDAPLFAYAIFYNLPLEIAPGPRMDIYGNVHSNWHSWFQAGSQLNLHSKVTIAGEFNHGRRPEYGKSSSGGSVKIKDSTGKLVSMKKDSTWQVNGAWPSDSASAFNSTWLASGTDNFADIANQIWDGNLQTGDHGVLPQNPVGISSYQQENLDTPEIELVNSAYTIIQPTLNKTELVIPNEADDPAAYEKAIKLNEVEKQKYAYKAGLTIEVDLSGNLRYYTIQRDAEGEIKYEDNGNPQIIELTPDSSKEFAKHSAFAESDGDVVGGLYEKRQAQELDIIELDIKSLKEMVHDDVKSEWGSDNDHKPSNWWNGIVYVDFPTPATTARVDNVNPAYSGWGLKVTNGDTIPNPSYAHGTDTYGMSLATNQMMYVEGNYNSDGDRGTGSPTEADNLSDFTKEGYEAPAALIADSITFLSNSWDDKNSNDSMSSRVATDTEVSAAILTGLVPSAAGKYSGGVENFPRFLENWGGKSLRIRGSTVALFQSEVGTRRWGYGDVYKPPSRDWGFHAKFGEGYLPPGTPNTRRYKAIDFQLLNESEYLTHVARIKTYF